MGQCGRLVQRLPWQRAWHACKVPQVCKARAFMPACMWLTCMQIARHIEYWSISGTEALLQLFRPAPKDYAPAASGSARQGR